MVEITLNAKEAMLAKVRKALSNKDKLVGQKGTQGRNKYQMEIQKIKDQVKGFEGLSFRDLLKEVKKEEREGKFDRGAEGKAKNKLRKKMAGAPKEVFTRGRHAGSKYDDLIPSRLDSEGNVDLSKALAGETEAQRKKRKEKMTTAKIGKSR